MTILQEPFRKPSDRKGALRCYEEFQQKKGQGLERCYATHVLDLKFNGECLSSEERIQKTKFIDKVATRKFGTEHSAEVIAKLAEHRSKEGLFRKAFLLKSASVIDVTLVERSVLQFKNFRSCSFYTKYASYFSSY